ncbi:GNAT family N-acetyltransferase [Pseudonocardia abyssalis]|uniref:GNAT family N-acetyltransferase n=1 Tax=Pseudonocardia abyssalis TaxID=2792008 RepID=A0ABS6UTG3_9PSEU|nr:GNAT family N-acetyltransferase [Pseudonocardia abyssalis]MBW0135541.1 GNAT family N-acetyltransferase [Pseudonocardia abyssalis]
MTPTLTPDRVVLRELRPSDAPALHRFRGDADARRHNDPHPTSPRPGRRPDRAAGRRPPAASTGDSPCAAATPSSGSPATATSRFRLEGRMREHSREDGAFHDVALHALLRLDLGLPPIAACRTVSA